MIGVFVFGMNKLSFAMMCGSEGEHSSQKHLAQANTKDEHGTTKTTKQKAGLSGEAVNVGNKICPVSAEKIGEEMDPVTYEYEGKIYNFCCAGCIDEFKKDPEKFINKVEQELQAESKEQTEHKEHEMDMTQESGASHQGKHQGHHH